MPTPEQDEQLRLSGNITYSTNLNQRTYTSGNGEIRENGPTPMYPAFDSFNETLLDFRPFGSWIKFERHIIKSCTCSYCNGVNPVWSHSRININTGSNQSKLLKYLRVRFNSPSNKSRTSWRRLTFKGIKYYYYLKWTLPRPELIAKKIMEIIGK